MRNDSSEALRIRYQYKRLILLGKLTPPLDVARRLIGPDSAYHLYFCLASGSTGRARRKTASTKMRANPKRVQRRKR